MLNQFNVLITTGFSGPLDYKQWLSCAMHAWPSRAMHAPNCSACYTLSSNSVKTSSKKSSKSCCASTSSTITENKQLIIPLINGERRRKKETERNGAGIETGRKLNRQLQKIGQAETENRSHAFIRLGGNWLINSAQVPQLKFNFKTSHTVIHYASYKHTQIMLHRSDKLTVITLYKKVIHTNLHL